MKIIKWEEVQDNRFKYNGDDPQWHKVYIESPNTPLGPDWKFNYCILAARYKSYMESIFNYKADKDDVWICSYPKSGTTWAQEMVWLIQTGFDFKGAKEKLLFQRSPTLRQIITEEEKIQQNQIDHYDFRKLNLKFERPYLIKNHLPVGLMPKSVWKTKPRIIYVARNPKDVALSFYNHYQNFFKYSGTLEEFNSLFLDNLVEFGPWSDHVAEFWELRNEDYILFLTYEEMKKNLPDVIKKTAEFLNKPVTEEQIQRSLEYLHISNMREGTSEQIATALAKVDNTSKEKLKEKAQKFFRKGEAGGFKKDMPEEVIKQFDELVKQRFGSHGPY